MEVLQQEFVEFGKSIEPAFKYSKSLQAPAPVEITLEEMMEMMLSRKHDSVERINLNNALIHYEIDQCPNKVIAKHKTINLTITDYGETAHIITDTINEIIDNSETWAKLSNDELGAVNDFIYTIYADPKWRKRMPIYNRETDTVTLTVDNVEPYMSFDIDLHGFAGFGKTSIHLFKALKAKMISLTQRRSDSTVINSKAISTYDGKFQHSLTVRADGSWSIKYADEYTGPLVGYKATTGRSGELVMCVLHVPESSRLDTGDNLKFRAEEVYVYDMFEPGFSPCAVCKKKTYLYEKPKYSQVQDFAIMSDPNFTFKCKDHINHTLASFVPVKQVDSSHSKLSDRSYIYTVKTVAKPANGSFTSRSVSCGIGIHFCISPVTLVDYLNLK